VLGYQAWTCWVFRKRLSAEAPQADARGAGERMTSRSRGQSRDFGPSRGPLARVPGLTGALVRAAVVALAQTAGVVLLDEPTAHLDPPTAAALVADLRRVLAGGLVVCVTHDPAVAGEDDSVLALGTHAPAWRAADRGSTFELLRALPTGRACHSPRTSPPHSPRKLTGMTTTTCCPTGCPAP
jgi:hypothetical protein